ncbi:MAG: Arc family DNA binding domain-containing protein [Planctomycetota bacterium]|nr:MAG: Arc family DNA binding domain-containing protein [Planctomycetota bacterium]
MATPKKSILLRISPELWEQLNIWARDELRSVNAQIEYILRDAVRRRQRGRAGDSASTDDQDSEGADAP